MALEKLIEALYRKADEQAEAIKREADAEAEKVREEARRKADALALKYRAEETRAVRDRTAEILAGAEAETCDVRQSSCGALLKRIRGLAFSLLKDLRESEYPRLFRALAAEMPKCDWEEIRVSPDDAPLAAAVFPGARVSVDKGISGGMEASADGGRVRVINTFEKRLERALDEILPGLLKEIYEECSKCNRISSS